MNSPKVKTQKNLSALIALTLAAVTLFSAGTANSSEPAVKKTKLVEAEIIAQIDQMLQEDEEALIIDEIVFDELESNVKVFGDNDELIGQGNTEGNKELRVLVNKADLVSEFGNTKYYRIVR